MLQFFRKFRLPVYEALILPFPSEVPNMQVSVSAILFLSYKIRADVLSTALIPLIR